MRNTGAQNFRTPLGYGCSSKKGTTMSVNIFGLTGGMVLVLGIYFIDMLTRTPALG